MTVSKRVQTRTHQVTKKTETEIIAIQITEEQETSLKELRALVEATRHLPEDAVVFTDGEYDDNGDEYGGAYKNYLQVDPRDTWSNRFAEWKEDDYYDPEDLEQAIVQIAEDLGLLMKGSESLTKSEAAPWHV